MQYLIYYFKNYDILLQSLFRELLLAILKDKQRFDIESQQLTYIITKLEQIDFGKATTNYHPQIGDLMYFTNKDTGELEPFINAVPKVHAMVLTKREAYAEYIKENFSPEFIDAYNTVNPTATQKLIQNDSKNTNDINKAHLARCFYEMIHLLDGNISDKTTIAKFLYFLINGKEAAERKDY